MDSKLTYPLPDQKPRKSLGKFGHHPDSEIDACVELDRLEGLLSEARGGLKRALDYAAVTPNGLAIKADIRNALDRIGWDKTPAPDR